MENPNQLSTKNFISNPRMCAQINDFVHLKAFNLHQDFPLCKSSWKAIAVIDENCCNKYNYYAKWIFIIILMCKKKILKGFHLNT